MTRAQLPRVLRQDETASALATFIDWTAPDLDEAILRDWESWNQFVDELPADAARRVVLRLEPPPP